MRERGQPDAREELEGKYARLLDADLGKDSKRNVEAFAEQLARRHSTSDDAREGWHAWRAKETQPEDKPLEGVQLRYAEDRNIAYATVVDDLLRKETGTGLKERHVTDKPSDKDREDDPFLAAAAPARPARALPESASNDNKWPRAPGPAPGDARAKIFERATPTPAPLSDKSRVRVQAEAQERIARPREEGVAGFPRDERGPQAEAGAGRVRAYRPVADEYARQLKELRDASPERIKSVERDAARLRDTASLKDPKELERQIQVHHDKRLKEPDPEKAEKLYTRTLALAELRRERSEEANEEKRDKEPAIRPLPTLTQEHTLTPGSDLEKRVHRFNVDAREDRDDTALVKNARDTETSPHERAGATASSDVFRDKSTDPQARLRAQDVDVSHPEPSHERPPILRIAELGAEHTPRVPESLSRLMAKELEPIPRDDPRALQGETTARPALMRAEQSELSVEGPPIHVRYDADATERDPRGVFAEARRAQDDPSRTDPDVASPRRGDPDTRPEGVRANAVVALPEQRESERTPNVDFKDLREQGRSQQERDETRQRENQEERAREKIQETWDRHALRLRDSDPERSQLVRELQESLQKRPDLRSYENATEALVEHHKIVQQTDNAVLLRSNEDLALALSQLVAERREAERATFRELRDEVVDEVRRLPAEEQQRIRAAVLSTLDSDFGDDQRFLRREVERHAEPSTPADRFALQVAAVAHAAPTPVRLRADFSFAHADAGAQDARDEAIERQAERIASTHTFAERQRELNELRVSLVMAPADAAQTRREVSKAEELAAALHRADELETASTDSRRPAVTGFQSAGDRRASRDQEDTTS